MNHRTIQKVKEGLLHNLTHLQPPSGVDRGLVMRHHLESAYPGKQKEYALKFNEKYAKTKTTVKTLKLRQLKSNRRLQSKSGTVQTQARSKNQLKRNVYLHRVLGFEQVVDGIDGLVLEKPVHGEDEGHED